MNFILKPLAVFKQRIIGGTGVDALAVNTDKNIQVGRRLAEPCSDNGPLQGNMLAGGWVDNYKTFSCSDISSYSFKKLGFKHLVEVSIAFGDDRDMSPSKA